MNKKVKTLKIIKNSLSFYKNNIEIIIGISILPFLIKSLINVLPIYFPNINIILPILLSLILIYVELKLAINIHRLVIKNIIPESYFKNFWNKEIKYFLIYGAALFIIPLLISLLIWSVPFLNLITQWVLNIILIILYLIFLFRHLLIFPSIAVGDEFSILKLGKKTKGVRLTLLFQSTIVFFLFMIIAIPHTAIFNIFGYNFLLKLLLNELVVIAATTFSIVTLSITYMEYKNFKQE